MKRQNQIYQSQKVASKDARDKKVQLYHTCRALSPPNDIELEKPRDEHSMLVQVWIQNEYIGRMCGRVGKSNIEVHLSQSDCHPTGHDNDWDDLCPEQNKIKCQFQHFHSLSINL